MLIFLDLQQFSFTIYIFSENIIFSKKLHTKSKVCHQILNVLFSFDIRDAMAFDTIRQNSTQTIYEIETSADII